jgi:hypothetical protein
MFLSARTHRIVGGNWLSLVGGAVSGAVLMARWGKGSATPPAIYYRLTRPQQEISPPVGLTRTDSWLLFWLLPALGTSGRFEFRLRYRAGC